MTLLSDTCQTPCQGPQSTPNKPESPVLCSARLCRLPTDQAGRLTTVNGFERGRDPFVAAAGLHGAPLVWPTLDEHGLNQARLTFTSTPECAQRSASHRPCPCLNFSRCPTPSAAYCCVSALKQLPAGAVVTELVQPVQSICFDRQATPVAAHHTSAVLRRCTVLSDGGR